ncbi:4-(cytidine 5'-diphospho)-2-C-methyl-D-erythritol kinase [Microvirga tunisiensis]|uniref:4-diphosphocytidyl-2-C-methyl-D-erythritol kinase n=2 Tax=Pannonibacter tanglangensis TaxID=2750084 RepID=A0A7X5J7X4_9HYPH|nr:MULTISPECIES: 4-(cytidine 5'-diphospho)-2-C-methyl-D-erythritol kinase [unclassified Pannonibacter]NBN63613.1 4-(cytidine 5'-diphospho)-2-C-methyl-D-erythritol kinase [Pannonibacter sp. XCT-34]NBN77247.1 4-(cytidine 5'-diphospho)-2-C-methyl-D-erythritol kinase [Pannonibacter sp. XCT-53]
MTERDETGPVRRGPPPPRVQLARAKVNLALHVTGRRADGYHLLDSLAVFPAIGDVLLAEPADQLDLAVEGPFGAELRDTPPEANLVLRAVRALADALAMPVPALHLRLTKRLPVASGIGGGSADAAAALRLVASHAGRDVPAEVLTRVAAALGADVPVCLAQAARRMRGIGDDLAPVPPLPPLGLVLVNPRQPVATPAVFKALQTRDNPPLPDLPEAFADARALTGYLAATRNDLEAPAQALCPAIGEVLEVLRAQDRVALARMSGSGATCFALCAPGDVNALTNDLQRAHPGWWVAGSPALQA